MTLARRLSKLEANRLEAERHKPGPGDGHAKLASEIDAIAARLAPSGDFEHNPNDSVASNLARAQLRGDTETFANIIADIKAGLQEEMARKEARLEATNG